jgi:hypothetical protein
MYEREKNDLMTVSDVLNSTNYMKIEKLLMYQNESIDVFELLLYRNITNNCTDSDISFLELVINNHVSQEEYLKFVTYKDVEHYLNGLLWVIKMYENGTCPDISYTYTSIRRPGITPHAIVRYIENKLLLNAGSDNSINSSLEILFNNNMNDCNNSNYDDSYKQNRIIAIKKKENDLINKRLVFVENVFNDKIRVPTSNWR